MNTLSLSFLNECSPYKITAVADELQFITDYGVEYRVGFTEDYSIWSENAFQFLINNRNKKASPNDPKLKDTILSIIDAFFISNPFVLLYICETGDDKQATLNRLYVRWFNESQRKQEFYFQDVTIRADGMDNFTAIIVQRSNPEIDNIISQFDEFVTLMSTKPK